MEKVERTPLRELLNKKIEVLGYETEIFNTNEYTIVKVKTKSDNKIKDYYTSSRTVKRQLDELNKANKLPLSTELITGEGHKGKWLAFKI